MNKKISNTLFFTASVLLINSAIYGQNLFTTMNGIVLIAAKNIRLERNKK